MPEPPIDPPDPGPTTKGVPETELQKFLTQWRLDRKKADQTYDATVGKADDALIKANGTWNTAQATFEAGQKNAGAVAETAVYQAVLVYQTSIADNTTTCPEKKPSALELETYWLTLYNSVATANATYETTMATLENTLETARGVYEGAVKTDARTRQSAAYTRDGAYYNADKTFWLSVQAARKAEV